MDNNLNILADSVRACRDAGKNYVIHPVGYSVLDKSDFTALTDIAGLADLALILHDERAPDGNRITGRFDCSLIALTQLST